MPTHPFDEFVKRGELVKVRIKFDGRVGCSWNAIYHGNGRCHLLNNRERGPFLIDTKKQSGDKFTKISRGWLFERFV